MTVQEVLEKNWPNRTPFHFNLRYGTSPLFGWHMGTEVIDSYSHPFGVVLVFKNGNGVPGSYFVRKKYMDEDGRIGLELKVEALDSHEAIKYLTVKLGDIDPMNRATYLGDLLWTSGSYVAYRVYERNKKLCIIYPGTNRNILRRFSPKTILEHYRFSGSVENLAIFKQHLTALIL